MEIELPYDPAIPLLGIHTEETRSERDMCTPMFIAALFVIARTWKQSRCPSADEWIRKLWYIYTIEYYSAIKKNSFESVLMRWMKLEPILQSEVSQKDKDQHSILAPLFICFSLPLGLPYVNWASQECYLFYLRSSLRSSDLPLLYFHRLFPSLSFSHLHSGLLFPILAT